MLYYEFAGFDRVTNKEYWRPVSSLRLHCRWLRDWMRGYRCARRGYEGWLYCNVTQGPLLPEDMLSFRDEIII